MHKIEAIFQKILDKITLAVSKEQLTCTLDIEIPKEDREGCYLNSCKFSKKKYALAAALKTITTMKIEILTTNGSIKDIFDVGFGHRSHSDGCTLLDNRKLFKCTVSWKENNTYLYPKSSTSSNKEPGSA